MIFAFDFMGATPEGDLREPLARMFEPRGDPATDPVPFVWGPGASVVIELPGAPRDYRHAIDLAGGRIATADSLDELRARYGVPAPPRELQAREAWAVIVPHTPGRPLLATMRRTD